MAKVPSKGTALQQEIAMVYTTVAQLTDISRAGTENETYDATTLDGLVYKEYEPTGYTEPGTIDISGLYDPALAGHVAITDLLGTPAKQNWKIIYADTALTEDDMTSAGISHELTAAMADGLRFSTSMKLTGTIDFAVTP